MWQIIAWLKERKKLIWCEASLPMVVCFALSTWNLWLIMTKQRQTPYTFLAVGQSLRWEVMHSPDESTTCCLPRVLMESLVGTLPLQKARFSLVTLVLFCVRIGRCCFLLHPLLTPFEGFQTLFFNPCSLLCWQHDWLVARSHGGWRSRRTLSNSNSHVLLRSKSKSTLNWTAWICVSWSSSMHLRIRAQKVCTLFWL